MGYVSSQEGMNYNDILRYFDPRSQDPPGGKSSPRQVQLGLIEWKPGFFHVGKQRQFLSFAIRIKLLYFPEFYLIFIYTINIPLRINYMKYIGIQKSYSSTFESGKNQISQASVENSLNKRQRRIGTFDPWGRPRRVVWTRRSVGCSSSHGELGVVVPIPA